jgi:hypothetical protein
LNNWWVVRSPYHSLSAPCSAWASGASSVKNSLISMWWASLPEYATRVRPSAANAGDDARRLGAGDEVRAGLIENPVIRGTARAALARRAEAIEHPQLVEDVEASGRGAQPGEVQPQELLGRQHVVVVTVERDLTVAVGEPRAEAHEVPERDLSRSVSSHSFPFSHCV